MRKNVLISVLMSVYNTEFAVVKRAIDSVLRQDFQDFELIIIDDGSDHDDANQLLRYAQQNQEKITYLRHKNRGQSNSINQGVLLSNGQYIAIIDADDEYKPEHLQACLNGMEEADLIASKTQTIVDREADYYVPDRKDENKLIHVDDCILFATFFGRKAVFSSLKFQDTYAADAQFFERSAERYRVRKLDLRTYVYYRNNPDSACSVLKNKYFTDQLAQV
jgi:glycosyltransferase involved in cell wall biosynthesis